MKNLILMTYLTLLFSGLAFADLKMTPVGSDGNNRYQIKLTGQEATTFQKGFDLKVGEVLKLSDSTYFYCRVESVCFATISIAKPEDAPRIQKVQLMKKMGNQYVKDGFEILRTYYADFPQSKAELVYERITQKEHKYFAKSLYSPGVPGGEIPGRLLSTQRSIVIGSEGRRYAKLNCTYRNRDNRYRCSFAFAE